MIQIKELKETLVASEEAKAQHSLELKAANHELKKLQSLQTQLNGFSTI
jgi:hypothetical protein